MKLSNTQIKRIIIAGGFFFLLLRFRGYLNPSKETLSAKDDNVSANGTNSVIDRAIHKVKSGGVKVASTPSEIKN
jgi:hypothetical protein